ncbi:hypothetical protein BDR26DRAFT_866860, partial [Obelidium mucronatum]
SVLLIWSECKCCLQSELRIKAVHSQYEIQIDALNDQLKFATEEVNLFRRLLDMPPVTSIQPTSPSNANRDIVNRNAQHRSSIQLLPLEVLNRIVEFVSSSKCVIFLCHTIPALKHISAAIYDVGIAFKMRPNQIWPSFWFPVVWKEDSHYVNGVRRVGNPIPISGKHLVPVSRLTHLLSRYGGAAKVQCHSVQYLESVLPLLPKTIDVYLQPDAEGYFGYYSGEDTFEKCIKLLRARGFYIRSMDIPADEFENPVNTTKLLQTVEAGKTLCWRILSLTSFSFKCLLDFPALVKIEFLGLDRMMDDIYFEGLVDILPRLESIAFVSFEDSDPDGKGLYGVRQREQLLKIGWREYWTNGGFYGYPCIVWAKIKLP